MLGSADSAHLVISAISATASGKLKEPHAGRAYLIYPAVSYFILAAGSRDKIKKLMFLIQRDSFGAKPKLLLQPYQQEQGHIYNELLHVVKDYSTEGFVRKQMDSSTAVNRAQPIVKFFVIDPNILGLANDVVSELQQHKFSCELTHCPV